MNKKELEFVLQGEEGQFIEFKEQVSGIEKEIAAFANSEGGRIILGVADKGEVKGIEINNKLKSQIQDIANNCDPKIDIFLENLEFKGKKIFIIKIPEGSDKPYRCSSGFYLRVGANSQKMKRDEILSMVVGLGKVNFDEQINKGFKINGDFDEIKFNDYLEKANLSKSVSKKRILRELGVMDSSLKNLNNAGVLFFAKNPQKFFQQSVYTAVVFRDLEGADVIERKEIGGSLVEIVEQVMRFVDFYVKVAYQFTGKPKRENVYEYPKEAIREVVINSVMHKNYFEPGHNNLIKIFPDRIQIENIWKKPKNFKLGETVFRRNPIIANLFSKIHFGEKLGSGFARIKEYCKNENAPLPEIKFTETHFYVIFKQNKKYLEIVNTNEEIEKTGEKDEKINSRQMKAIEYLQKNDALTISKYISINNVSDKTARRDINDLIDKKILSKEGTTTNAVFKLRSTSVNFGQDGKVEGSEDGGGKNE